MSYRPQDEHDRILELEKKLNNFRNAYVTPKNNGVSVPAAFGVGNKTTLLGNLSGSWAITPTNHTVGSFDANGNFVNNVADGSGRYHIQIKSTSILVTGTPANPIPLSYIDGTQNNGQIVIIKPVVGKTMILKAAGATDTSQGNIKLDGDITLDENHMAFLQFFSDIGTNGGKYVLIATSSGAAGGGTNWSAVVIDAVGITKDMRQGNLNDVAQISFDVGNNLFINEVVGTGLTYNITPASQAHYFKTSSTERMRIDDTRIMASVQVIPHDTSQTLGGGGGAFFWSWLYFQRIKVDASSTPPSNMATIGGIPDTKMYFTVNVLGEFDWYINNSTTPSMSLQQTVSGTPPFFKLKNIAGDHTLNIRQQHTTDSNPNFVQIDQNVGGQSPSGFIFSIDGTFRLGINDTNIKLFEQMDTNQNDIIASVAGASNIGTTISGGNPTSNKYFNYVVAETWKFGNTLNTFSGFNSLGNPIDPTMSLDTTYSFVVANGTNGHLILQCKNNSGTAQLGFFGHTPSSQQSRPVTLTDVINLLVAYGLSA